MDQLLCFVLCILTRRWLGSLKKAPPLLPVPNTHQLILHIRKNLRAAKSCSPNCLSFLPKVCGQMVKHMQLPAFIHAMQIAQSHHTSTSQVKE